MLLSRLSKRQYLSGKGREMGVRSRYGGGRELRSEAGEHGKGIRRGVKYKSNASNCAPRSCLSKADRVLAGNGRCRELGNKDGLRSGSCEGVTVKLFVREVGVLKENSGGITGGGGDGVLSE